MDQLIQDNFFEVANDYWGYFVVKSRIQRKNVENGDDSKAVIYFNKFRTINDSVEGNILDYLTRPSNDNLLQVFRNLFYDETVITHTKQWILKRIDELLDHEKLAYIVVDLAKNGG